VPWDNNLAQRNVEVVELGNGGMLSVHPEGQATVLFQVTNVRVLPTPVDLIIERGTFPSTGMVVLEFGDDLFSRWLAETGGNVIGGNIIPGTTQISITDPISTTIIGLPMGVRETQQARMYLTGSPTDEFALHVSASIEGDIVGGMTYRTEFPWTVYLPTLMRGSSSP
jgi:hypothetical protein